MLEIASIEVQEEKPVQNIGSLAKYRDEFRAAVDKDRDWRDEAKEDVEFYYGKQWSDSDRLAMNEVGRPIITINRIKPLINLLSGYQRLNRYEPEFLPRTKSDMELCNVRKGVTKYILDSCDYVSVESQVFLDGCITGRGWLEVTYDWDYSALDGDINVKRVSPFDVYVDPESVKPDYSDAKFIFKAKWADKEELKAVYPEHADFIEFQSTEYDRTEDIEFVGLEPLWYQRDTNRVRVVERWGKKTEPQTYYLLHDGQLIPRQQINAVSMLQIKKPVTLPTTKVYVSVFIGELLLEEKESPYEHGEFPIVPYLAYFLGENDIPAGVVRDIKDVQREVNKRRSQSLHILGTQANSGWMYEQGALTAQQKTQLSKFGATPGAQLEVTALSQIQRINPPNPPVGIMQAEQAAVQDIRDISGINEGMLGTDIAQSTSGRAIELRQRQAVTHIGALFDNLRRTKQKMLFLMWGKRGKKGVIQQYFNEQKTFRIIGENGQTEFIEVNKPVVVNDPLMGAIQQTLNDLSAGEFDIVVSDTPSTSTQRQAQFWALTDAISKLGIPGDMVFDIIIDLSDIPQKEEIKKRWTERQQAQSQQNQQTKITTQINIKDIPPDAQAQMLAKIGIQTQQQQNPFIPIMQQLPIEMVGAITQMDAQQLTGAMKILFNQLPPQVQQMIGKMLQSMPPEQVLQMVYEAAVTVVNGQGGGQQLPSYQQQNSPQTMTAAAQNQIMQDMRGGM